MQTISGDPTSRVSSLVWCSARSKDRPSGRLFSSSIDGSISEWDLFDLTQKVYTLVFSKKFCSFVVVFSTSSQWFNVLFLMFNKASVSI